jgi:hypothetical protein
MQKTSDHKMDNNTFLRNATKIIILVIGLFVKVGMYAQNTASHNLWGKILSFPKQH